MHLYKCKIGAHHQGFHGTLWSSCKQLLLGMVKTDGEWEFGDLAWSKEEFSSSLASATVELGFSKGDSLPHNWSLNEWLGELWIPRDLDLEAEAAVSRCVSSDLLVNAAKCTFNPLGIGGKNSSRGVGIIQLQKVCKMPIPVLEEDGEPKLTFISHSQRSCVERKSKKKPDSCLCISSS